jgi:hypothetical protein
MFGDVQEQVESRVRAGYEQDGGRMEAVLEHSSIVGR